MTGDVGIFWVDRGQLSTAPVALACRTEVQMRSTWCFPTYKKAREDNTTIGPGRSHRWRDLALYCV